MHKHTQALSRTAVSHTHTKKKTFTHNTTWSYITVFHTQLLRAHTHNFVTYNSFTHNFVTRHSVTNVHTHMFLRNFITQNPFTRKYPIENFVTTHARAHAKTSHTLTFPSCGRLGTSVALAALRWLWRRAWSLGLCAALCSSVAFGDGLIVFVLQVAGVGFGDVTGRCGIS